MRTYYKKISSHGTISIPVEVRRYLGLEPGDRLELSTDGETISLKAYTPRCIFCGEAEPIGKRFFAMAGRVVCPRCAEQIAAGSGKEETA